MVPTVWIYSIQFGFWPPQLHQHLHPHSTSPVVELIHYLQICTGTNIHTCMTCTDYRIRATSTNKWPHHFVHATLYTTTLLVYPLVTTSTLYWITTNTSATYTTRPFCCCWQLTGSIACSAKRRLFKLLRGRFWGFSPRIGDTLHRLGEIWHKGENQSPLLRAKFHPSVQR